MNGKTNLANIRHGAVFFCNVPKMDFNPHVCHGGHYYIVYANNLACKHSPVLHAIPLTSNCNRRLPCQVPIESDIFPKSSYALAEQLTILPKDILKNGRFCGNLSSDMMQRVEKAVKIQLAIA